jgi:hypothetical protein
MIIRKQIEDGRFEIEGFVSKPSRDARAEVEDFVFSVYVGDIMFGCDLLDVTDRVGHAARKHYEEELIQQFYSSTWDPDAGPDAVDPDDEWKYDRAYGEGKL